MTKQTVAGATVATLVGEGAESGSKPSGVADNVGAGVGGKQLIPGLTTLQEMSNGRSVN
jgi:hypothetical protein